MSSEFGLAMMHDVLSGNPSGDNPIPCQCAAFTQSQIQIVLDRGVARGEAVPQAEAIMDGVVAPIIYRTLFGPAPFKANSLPILIKACMQGAKRHAENLRTANE